MELKDLTLEELARQVHSTDTLKGRQAIIDEAERRAGGEDAVLFLLKFIYCLDYKLQATYEDEDVTTRASRDAA